MGPALGAAGPPEAYQNLPEGRGRCIGGIGQPEDELRVEWHGRECFCIDLAAEAGKQPLSASLRQRCITLFRTARKAESSRRRRGGFNTVAQAGGIGEGAHAPHQIVWRR